MSFKRGDRVFYDWMHCLGRSRVPRRKIGRFVRYIRHRSLSSSPNALVLFDGNDTTSRVEITKLTKA